MATYEALNQGLWHVSEQAGIAVFEPRWPPRPSPGITQPVVWSVDAARLPHYLLPRECPRVCFRRQAPSTATDVQTLLGSPSACVVAVERAWLDTIATTTLTAYELPPAPFRCIDANAGYHVSTAPVVRLRTLTLGELPTLFGALGVELRPVDDLRALAAHVAVSTLAFSIIRMRNAQAVVSAEAGAWPPPSRAG